MVNYKVFECKLPTTKTLPLFVGLVVLNGLILDFLINWLGQLGIAQVYAKVIGELLFYVPNYWILGHWVFTKSGKYIGEVK